MNEKTMGVYVHIPFCTSRCDYCDFYSTVGLGAPQQGQYVSSLLHEWECYAACGIRNDWRIETLYIGGGTPTVLVPAHLERLLDGLMERFDTSRLQEFTIEANPGTLTEEKLKILRDHGCDRLSLGVQSFDPFYLKWLGRSHDVQAVYDSWAMARSMGWDNLSLDLMYGLQDQTLDHWRQTLQQALDLQPEHLSLYQLNIEPGTPMAERVARGDAHTVDEETARQQYLLAREVLLAAGYAHYEISNYAKPGKQSRHNTLYWKNQEYVGMGAGASGYINRVRYTNHKDLTLYTRMIKRNRVPRAFEETIDGELQKKETILLGLRLTEGVDKKAYQQCFGRTLEEDFGAVIRKHEAQGLMENREDTLRLTLEGLLLSNEILVDFF